MELLNKVLKLSRKYQLRKTALRIPETYAELYQQVL